MVIQVEIQTPNHFKKLHQLIRSMFNDAVMDGIL